MVRRLERPARRSGTSDAVGRRLPKAGPVPVTSRSAEVVTLPPQLVEVEDGKLFSGEEVAIRVGPDALPDFGQRVLEVVTHVRLQRRVFGAACDLERPLQRWEVGERGRRRIGTHVVPDNESPAQLKVWKKRLR